MAKPIKIDIIGDAKRFTDAADGVSGKLGGLIKGVGVAGLAFGALAIGAVVGLAKIGEEFDKSYDKIRIGTGKTGDVLKGLEGSFRKVATSVAGVTFDQAADAVTILNQRLGVTGPTLDTLAKQFLQLSKITGTDLKIDVDNITRAFGDWGIAVADQAKAIDKFYRATQVSGIGLGMLTEQVVEFGAPLRNLGFTFDQAVAIFSLWNKTGVNTTTVMGGLKQAVGNFAKQGKDAPKALQETIATIQKMGNGADATALAVKTFGKRAGPDVVDAILGGKFAIADYVKTIANGSDTVAKGAKDTERFGDKLKQLKNIIWVQLEPIATRVYDLLGKGLSALAPTAKRILGSIKHDIEKFRSVLHSGQTAGPDGEIVGALMPEKSVGKIERFALIVRGLWGNIKDFLDTLRHGRKETESGELIGGFLPAIKPEQLTKMENLAMTLRRLGTEALPILKQAAHDVWDAMVGLWTGAQNLYGYLQDHQAVVEVAAFVVGGVLVAAFTAWAVSAGAAAVSTVLAMAPVILIGALFGSLALLIYAAYQKSEDFRNGVHLLAIGFTQVVWPALKNVGGWIKDTLIPIIGDVVAKVGDWGATFIEQTGQLVGIVKDLVVDIGHVLEGIYDYIVAPFQKAMEWVKKFAGWLIPGSTSGKDPGAGHAMGGAATRGWVTVGERGPERMMLTGSAQFQPASAGGSGGGGDTYNFYGTNVTAAEVGRELAWRRRVGDGR